jgi:PIN domain nuclease of toxin-antitoxin system
VILLDTHVLARLLFEPKRLSRPATKAIERAVRSEGIGVASITLWELACLFVRGRIRHSGTVESAVERVVRESGVVVREVTPVIAALAAQFPIDFPGDPADRLIAATARAEGIQLITADERIRGSTLVKTVW